MTDDPVPFIAEKDYEAFRRIIKDLSDTYDDWLKLHETEKSVRRRQGHTPKEIDVRPHEFAEFCRGKEGSLQLLLHFAIAKAEPQRVISDEDEKEG